MLFLGLDVCFHLLDLRRADGERPVATLPVELWMDVFFGPLRGFLLHLLNHFAHRECSRQYEEQVNVVWHPSNDYRRAVDRIQGTPEIGEGSFTMIVTDVRLAVLRAENKV